MNIDKDKLKLGIWYEDTDGNIYRNNDDSVEKPRANIVSRHTCYPTEINEKIEMYYDNKETCRHPLRYRKRTHGWIKGIKGCKCEKCGKTKTGKSYIPFVFMEWEKGSNVYPLITFNSHLCKLSQECVVSMVNSGDYELDEALVVMATACERCGNVLIYKYLNGKDGYPEYSDEWKKANTVCDFCKDED